MIARAAAHRFDQCSSTSDTNKASAKTYMSVCYHWLMLDLIEDFEME
jgi:hypothetical protein